MQMPGITRCGITDYLILKKIRSEYNDDDDASPLLEYCFRNITYVILQTYADIIDYLESLEESSQGYIKQLIRDNIEAHK